MAGQAESLPLDTLIDRCQELGLVRNRGRARTDATHVLSNVKLLNRLELIGETLRATLNVPAVVASEWLRELAEPEWYGRALQPLHREPLPTRRRQGARCGYRADWFGRLQALARSV